jgi:hypothetical protein
VAGKPVPSKQELNQLKERLYMAVVTAAIAYTLPKVIDLMSQLTLFLLQTLLK